VKPAQVNSSQTLCRKKTITKKGLVEWLKVKALSSNPSTSKQKEKKSIVTPICFQEPHAQNFFFSTVLHYFNVCVGERGFLRTTNFQIFLINPACQSMCIGGGVEPINIQC
jgi:hypothetical protein